ncbi:MAG: hypothetical protein ABR880_01950 [Candidatus Sulfotelmatobacter sp.]|jgi:hypothetical protein
MPVTGLPPACQDNESTHKMKILSEAGKNKHGQKLVRAECACGNTFIAREDNVKSGRTKHCENCRKKPAKKSAQKATQKVAPESASSFERGSVAWLDDQIKSKERAALAAEVRVKDLQAALAASESTDLDLLKKWTAESAAFEKLNHQISRLQIQKAKAETAVPKEQKSAQELTREKIRALKAAQ